MDNKLLIENLEDMQTAIELLLLDPTGNQQVEISKDFTLSIKLKGRSWDGLVDVRVANYVMEAQRTLDRARKEATLDTGERPLVKVQVKDGSTELHAKIANIVEGMVQNMNGNQQFIILLTVIGCAFGGWTLGKVLTWLDERKKAQLAHDEKTAGTKATQDSFSEMNQTLRFALEKLDPEKPVRTLVKGMGEEDTLSLPTLNSPISKNEARTRYPRKPRVNPIDAMIDDNYNVTSVAVEQPVRLSLERGGFEFKASLSAKLSTADIDAFVERVKGVLEKGGALRVPLQIDARLGESAVASAVVVAIGQAPREEAEDLTAFYS